MEKNSDPNIERKISAHKSSVIAHPRAKAVLLCFACLAHARAVPHHACQLRSCGCEHASARQPHHPAQTPPPHPTAPRCRLPVDACARSPGRFYRRTRTSATCHEVHRAAPPSAPPRHSAGPPAPHAARKQQLPPPPPPTPRRPPPRRDPKNKPSPPPPPPPPLMPDLNRHPIGSPRDPNNPPVHLPHPPIPPQPPRHPHQRRRQQPPRPQQVPPQI